MICKLGCLEKGFYCSISVVPSVISHYKDVLERFVFLLQLFEQSDCRLSINRGALLYHDISGIMCIDHSVDIDPLPATVGLNLFVLTLLYPTVCTMCIMLWMSTISVINGGFSAPFVRFCSASFASIIRKNFSCSALSALQERNTVSP